jgi:hypothetical protein
MAFSRRDDAVVVIGEPGARRLQVQVRIALCNSASPGVSSRLQKMDASVKVEQAVRTRGLTELRHGMLNSISRQQML